MEKALQIWQIWQISSDWDINGIRVVKIIIPLIIDKRVWVWRVVVGACQLWCIVVANQTMALISNLCKAIKLVHPIRANDRLSVRFRRRDICLSCDAVIEVFSLCRIYRQRINWMETDNLYLWLLARFDLLFVWIEKNSAFYRWQRVESEHFLTWLGSCGL